MDKITMFFAALYHDVGKPDTTKFNEKKQDVQSINHESIGAEIAQKSLFGFVPNKYLMPIKALIEHHMISVGMSDTKILKLADTLAKNDISWLELIELRLSDGLGRISSKTDKETIEENSQMISRVRKLGVLHNPLPELITGKELIQLGLKQGKMIGMLIEEVRKLQLAQRIHSNSEAVEFCKTRIKNIMEK